MIPSSIIKMKGDDGLGMAGLTAGGKIEDFPITY
jgi:hypothetical protein